MEIFHKLIGVSFPVVQAPMAGVQDSRLTIAVSESGGLGSLPCAMLSVDQLRSELNAIKAATSKPYNVNFFCHHAPKLQQERELAWRETLSDYYQEFGLSMDLITDGPTRTPFNEEMCAVLEEFKPPVVSFHFGLPSATLLQRVKAWGATVLSSATTVDEARWLENHGADAVIAQGVEAGGHRGMFLSDDLTTQLGTLALLPQVIDSVDVPVIAAGGLVDAKSVSVAMALGAAAVQVGTAYLLCPEATTSVVHRRALVSSAATHTALTNVFSGRPARGIVNRVIREVGPISVVVPEFPLATAALAPLRKWMETQGKGDFSPLWCGQNAGGCKEIPAAELTRELAADLACN